MKRIQTLLVATMAGLCLSAFAQWQWIDKDGRKVFSDRAPPADILDKNILKRPAGQAVAPARSTEEAPETNVSTQLPPAANQEKELEAKKKKAEEAETAKRKADEERVIKARIENCARAKQAKATYESGTPIARTNAAGQREIMDETTRAMEVKRLQAIMASDCR